MCYCPTNFQNLEKQLKKNKDLRCSCTCDVIDIVDIPKLAWRRQWIKTAIAVNIENTCIELHRLPKDMFTN